MVFPYGSSLAAWVIFQVILAGGIIHNGRKLVVGIGDIFQKGQQCGKNGGDNGSAQHKH